MIRLLLALTPLLLYPSAPSSGEAAGGGETGETISLAEIEPGDAGVWKTVVSGREVESFPLTVVGVLDSFAGPDMPILLCRAGDEINTRTGPVSGMSGSPVYIKGRLAGAYAYGFPWSKEKTLIGVTPIEWMEPLLDQPDQPYRRSQGGARRTSGGGGAETVDLGLPSVFSAEPTGPGEETSPLPLPLPLLASGVSPEVLRAVGPWLAERGLRPTAGGSGRAGAADGPPSLEAGSPLAVVLATGDIRIGGVGTITSRSGDRFLAFGHPMLGAGSVELPVASAEIVDVVSNYRISFKLSNIGEVVGTLWQDSAPGIQGEIGRLPYMIPIRVRSDSFAGSPVTGSLAEHRLFTPVMALIYAAQTVFASGEGPAEATLHGTLDLSLEGHDPVRHSRSGVGTNGAMGVLFSFAEIIDLVLNGAQEFPRLESVEIDLRTENVERRQILHGVRLESARISPGETVGLRVRTRLRDGGMADHSVEIPVPAEAGEYTVFVADADSLRSYDRLAARDPGRPLSDLLSEIRRLRPNDAIHVQLLRPNPGLRLGGRNLEDLPPSVLRLYQTSLEQPGDTFLRESVVWETSLPVPGVFSGSARIDFQTEP
ncbi:MAG: hypothetical protein ACLFRP_00200 [Puniceicoccaceae bacterium]